ncbi:DUF6862 domain-containing protein [Cupriavidus sp. UME77]|uniref:DUF6862 domain-containing protein n=1 Tax=Cupriavidus sp. UME77 TaxID=1862321 RepID=UPI001602F03D
MEAVLASLNRDTDGANQALDKIFDAKKVKEQQEENKVRAELVQQLAPMVYDKAGDLLQGQPTATKVAVHGLLGGLMSMAIGGNFAAGAAGGAAAKLAVESFGAQLLGMEGVSVEDRKALVQLAGMIVGGLAGGAAGGSGSDLAVGGSVGKVATENNYLKHQEILDFTKANQSCTASGNAEACRERDRLVALDKQRDAALSACAGSSSAVCTGLQQEVRSAQAEILRKRDDTFGAFGASPVDYILLAMNTEAQAAGTMSKVDRLVGTATGAGHAIAQGLADMAKLAGTVVASGMR